MIKGYLEYISKEIDSHSSKYDNFLLLDDFNSEPTEEAMKNFCQIYNVVVWSKLRKNSLKVDPIVTKKHTISKEINALVY